MTEILDELVVRVRADMTGLQKDMSLARTSLESGLGDAADRAGDRLEQALGRAIRTGKFGFEDLKRTALAVLNEIAISTIRAGISGGSGGSGGGTTSGLISLATSLATSFLGAPGRATGGPVSPGRAYKVGERGPEYFVPTSAGHVQAAHSGNGSGGGGGRDVRVAISINAPAGQEPRALQQSSRQIARAVRSALAAVEG